MCSDNRPADARVAARTVPRSCPEPTHTAVGTWSGGRFMHFGEPLDDERLLALLRPDEAIRTVLTADVYGEGEADRLLGRALAGVERDGVQPRGRRGPRLLHRRARGRPGLPALHRPAPARRGRLRRLPAQRDRAQPGAPGRRRASTCCCCTTRTAPATPSEAVWDGMAALRDAGPHRPDRRRAGARQRLHARPDRLPRALRASGSTGRW